MLHAILARMTFEPYLNSCKFHPLPKKKSKNQNQTNQLPRLMIEGVEGSEWCRVSSPLLYAWAFLRLRARLTHSPEVGRREGEDWARSRPGQRPRWGRRYHWVRPGHAHLDAVRTARLWSSQPDAARGCESMEQRYLHILSLIGAPPVDFTYFAHELKFFNCARNIKLPTSSWAHSP